MKFPTQIQFHRPEIFKSDDNPNLKALFHKDKDNPVGENNIGALQAQRLKQQDRASRHRLLGGLVTFGGLSPEITKWSEGRISNDEIKNHFRNRASKLSAAWRSDWTAENDPPKFVALAQQCQAEKGAMFACSSRAPDKLETALACANILHAKEGHNENVVSVTGHFLINKEIEARLINDRTRFRPVAFDKEQFTQDMRNAARWHGLSDRDGPVSVLAAKRALSPEEKARYIDLRSADSAKIYDEIGLPKGRVPALIRQTRVFGEASRKRPLAAQFLDLMDRIAAMGAKPFFQAEGRVDAKKIFAAIDNDLANDNIYIDSNLKIEVRKCVESGRLDTALRAVRKENTYVRA